MTFTPFAGWRLMMQRFCLLLLLLVAMAMPALARDSGPNPWEVVDGLLRHSGKPVPDPRRPRPTVSKVEAAELWDAFLTRVVKHAAGESDDAARRQHFLLVLLSGRYDGLELLAREAWSASFGVTFSRVAAGKAASTAATAGSARMSALAFSCASCSC